MGRTFSPKRVAVLAIATLFAATAAAVYHSFTFSRFIPIRVRVVDTHIDAEHRLVPVTLPDLSSLRGETAVLALRLENTGVEERRIGLLRDGFPAHRVIVPPERTIRWNIVLTPELVQALDAGVGGGGRTLEITGDADRWALTGLEIRNYYASWVGVMAVVIPRSARRQTLRTGVLPLSFALFVLALLNGLAYSKLKRASLRLIGLSLALAAFLVYVTCLILPRISVYTLLLSPSAFVLLTVAWLSPLFLYLGSRAPTFIAALPQTIAQRWARHEVTFERAATVAGLAAIAIAQPIFDVISNSPEFFAARGTTPAVALAAVFVLCVGVPVALAGIERAIRAFAPRGAAIVHGLTLTVLAAAVVMPWFRRTDDFVAPWEGVIGVLVGVAVALAYPRLKIVRQFLTALAPAALIVPALFLLNPDVQRNFLPSESAAAVGSMARTPPIVLVVFDELPLNSLLDGRAGIDAGRYPNFAALASQAYWFRNATTVWHNTSYAVPAILSGRYPPSKAVPTLRDYPVNLFTTLARHYSIFASLRYQQLCPARVCQDNSAMTGDTVGLLLSDLGLVWLHIMLPLTLTDNLPAVDTDWAEFGGGRDMRQGQRGAGGRGAVFAQFVDWIDRQPARLYFIHSMFPHMPFEYVPSGHRYRASDAQTRTYRGAGLFEGRSAAYTDTLHQRHLAQVGFVDHLVGDLMTRLRAQHIYDEALVIVTADHGASYREGRSRRLPQQNNVSDVVGVPLFVKLPGQQRGEVVDRIVETVDIFPTILDVVGAQASIRLDGRSLIAPSPERQTPPFLLRARYKKPPSVADVSADRVESLQRKERRFGSGDFATIYAPPEARHMLGKILTRSAIQQDVEISIRDPRQFASLSGDRDELPLYVQGSVNTSRPDPLTIAVVVNGTVAAVTHSYRDRKTHVFGVLIPETSLRDGDNEVSAFAVDDQTRLKP